jgi:hypothetical protein
VNGWQKMVVLGLALVVVLLISAAATACPTCKDNLAHDPASANLVRGYAYSILFMLSMPPLIFCGLSAYFYWEVRKAKARGGISPVGNALRGVP